MVKVSTQPHTDDPAEVSYVAENPVDFATKLDQILHLAKGMYAYMYITSFLGRSGCLEFVSVIIRLTGLENNASHLYHMLLDDDNNALEAAITSVDSGHVSVI